MMHPNNYLIVGLSALLLLAGNLAANAAAPGAVALWPTRTDIAHETVQPDNGDGVTRLTDITNPSIQPFLLSESATPTPAVLVCPGGGYRILAYNKEGTEVAEWLNSIGVAAVVLKYSVPGDRAAALNDAQRAMGVIRQNAKAWNINSEEVGVLGFSAGGHLSAHLSTQGNTRAYDPIDEADALPCVPNFSVLVYPAYLAKDSLDLAPEIAVSADTPPAFIVQTQDDRHYIDSAVAYYVALKKASVSAELHLFPEGGHGYGLRPSAHAVSGWPALCARWFKTIGALK